MVVDVAHSNNRGFRDVMRVVTRPVVDSHTEAVRSVVARQKEDLRPWQRSKSPGGDRSCILVDEGDVGSYPPSPMQLPQRQIHLDFHTGPALRDVGADFDARAFARTMKRAHVNSVTVFAKCHHGHLYYNTNRPERHPGLPKNLDLLRRQIEALHEEGIRAPIYISVQCDEYAAQTHPEWICLNPDKTVVKGGADVFVPAWSILDMSSPYQDYLAEQVEEVLRLFRPVDGIFFDMCWDQVSVSKWAVAGMERAGLDPQVEADRQRYAHQVALAYMRRFYRMVKRSSPGATVFFNSRPHSNLHEEHRWQTHLEIEALPSGFWGYLYFPKNIRHARLYGKPTMGMTARFHKSWADFGGYKPHAALHYEVSQMLAHGAACSIGDQLHPRGVLEPAAYDLIGRVYGHAEACEPWTRGAQALTEIGLFRQGMAYLDPPGSAVDGATRMLMQLKHQFDILTARSELNRYQLLILADEIPVDATLAARLRAFVRGGGKLLLTGQPPAGLAGEAGLKVLGESPFTVTYFRLRETNHVMYERGWRVRPAAGATVLARVVEPYFERTWRRFCSHFQTPYRPEVSPYAAAIQKGNIITIPYPIFKAYASHANLSYRELVKLCLDRLLPRPLLKVTGPSTLEATVMKQGRRTVVHLLSYCAERRTQSLDVIEDIIPLRDVPVSLRLAKPPRRVYLAPQNATVPFTFQDGRVELVVPELVGHQMIVFE